MKVFRPVSSPERRERACCTPPPALACNTARVAARASLPAAQRAASAKSPYSLRHRQGGFTLVEVVISLAIFVIGATAIVRIFVPALGVIENSGDSSIAGHAAQSVLARNNSSAGAPDWITEGNGTTDQEIAFNGTVNKNSSLPRDSNSTANSALGLYKVISGERQTLLRDSSNNLVVLTNFPYSGTVTVKSEDYVDNVVLTGSPLLDSTSSNYGRLSFAGATLRSTGAAFNDGVTYPTRPPDGYRTDTLYYISYRWIDTAGNINSVVDEPYSFPTDANWSSAPDTLSLDQVAQARILDPSASPQLKIVGGTVAVRVVSPAAIAGPVYPDGANPTFFDSSVGVATLPAGSPLTAGTQVYLVYTADWSSLITDVALPGYSVGDFWDDVTLPVKNLDETKPSWVTALVYAAPYQNLVGTMARANWLSSNVSDGPQNVILKMDTRSGRKNSRLSLYAGDGTPPATPTPNPTPMPAPRRARIGYATTNKWAQQLSVAAASYVPYLPAAGFYLTGTRPTNLVSQPWREYYWSLSAPAVMLFHPAEAGKTVSVTYLDSNSQRQTDILIIDNDIDATAPVGFLNPAGMRAAKTELTHSALSILSVKGLSVQARSAWVAGGRYTQAVASDFRKN